MEEWVKIIKVTDMIVAHQYIEWCQKNLGPNLGRWQYFEAEQYDFKSEFRFRTDEDYTMFVLSVL